MVTIETIATVMEDGTIMAKAPATLPRGRHRVVIVVEDEPLLGDAAAEIAERPRFPDLASFRDSLGAPVHPGNTILEMREEERS